MPTVEMIRVKLVSVRIANRMLASHLCQSKNSEVLNTFHPESGGGARSAIRKRAEGEWLWRFLRLVVLRVEVSKDAVVMAVWQEARGWCSRNYIPRIKESWGGLRWKDMKDALCCRICGLTPGRWFKHLLAGVVQPNHQQTRKKWSLAIMRVHALAYAYSAVDVHKVAPESKEK